MLEAHRAHEAGTEDRNDGSRAAQVLDELFDRLELAGLRQVDGEPRPERVVRFDDRDVEAGSPDAYRRNRGERLHRVYREPLAGAAVPPLLEPSFGGSSTRYILLCPLFASMTRSASSELTSKVSRPDWTVGCGAEPSAVGATGCCETVSGPDREHLHVLEEIRRGRDTVRVRRGRRDVNVVARRDLVRDAALRVHVHRDRDKILLGDRLRERPTGTLVRRDERLRGDELLRIDAARRDLVDEVVHVRDDRRRHRPTRRPSAVRSSRLAAPLVRSCPSQYRSSRRARRRSGRCPARACPRSRRTRRPRSPRQQRGRWPRRPSAFGDSTPRLPSERTFSRKGSSA